MAPKEQRGFFSVPEHLEPLGERGHPLEVLDVPVDFAYFRDWLVKGPDHGGGRNGGWLQFDPVSVFKALILQAQHNLSDAKMAFMIRDRLWWMRFLDRLQVAHCHRLPCVPQTPNGGGISLCGNWGSRSRNLSESPEPVRQTDPCTDVA